MKNFSITLVLSFLFFFLFLPNTYALEIPENIEEKELTCNSEDLEFCSGFSYKYAFWDSSLSSYKDSGLYDGNRPGYRMWFAPGFKFDVSVGPSTMYPAYIYQIGANSYDYDFEKGKIYRIYYYFSFEKDLQLLDNIYAYKYDWSTFSVKGTDEKVYDDYIDFFHRFNYGLKSYSPETPDNKFHFVLYFEFEPSISFTNLSFKLGTNHFNNDNVLKLISNPWTSSELFSYNINYDNFKIVETSSFLSSSGTDHGGGGIDLDKPSQSDTKIFDNLDTCDTMDFGCHFNNLLTMLKNTFTRIGNFFVSILDYIVSIVEFFVDFFVKLGDFFVDFFQSSFIPDSDYLSTKFQGLFKFIDEKLGFLTFPFEFIGNFLDRFLNIPNNPVKNITVPSISLGSFGTLIHGFSFNIAEYWEKAPFKQIYDVYLLFIHAFIVFGLYKLCIKKFEEMTGGSNK